MHETRGPPLRVRGTRVRGRARQGAHVHAPAQDMEVGRRRQGDRIAAQGGQRVQGAGRALSDREGAVGVQEAAARSVDLPDGRIRPERDRGARPGERGRRRGLREGGGELDEKDEREDEDDRETPRTKGRVAVPPRETAGPLGGSGSGELGCGRRHIRLLARIV